MQPFGNHRHLNSFETGRLINLRFPTNTTFSNNPQTSRLLHGQVTLALNSKNQSLPSWNKKKVGTKGGNSGSDGPKKESAKKRRRPRYAILSAFSFQRSFPLSVMKSPGSFFGHQLGERVDLGRHVLIPIDNFLFGTFCSLPDMALFWMDFFCWR